jgi:hypothetical protein
MKVLRGSEKSSVKKTIVFWKRQTIQEIKMWTATRILGSGVLEHSDTLRASVASLNSSNDPMAALYLAAASDIVSPVKNAARNCKVADKVDG